MVATEQIIAKIIEVPSIKDKPSIIVDSEQPISFPSQLHYWADYRID